jgi:hypothetical protein
MERGTSEVEATAGRTTRTAARQGAGRVGSPPSTAQACDVPRHMPRRPLLGSQQSPRRTGPDVRPASLVEGGACRARCVSVGA